jgi:hypothetical protein
MSASLPRFKTFKQDTTKTGTKRKLHYAPRRTLLAEAFSSIAWVATMALADTQPVRRTEQRCAGGVALWADVDFAPVVRISGKPHFVAGEFRQSR